MNHKAFNMQIITQAHLDSRTLIQTFFLKHDNSSRYLVNITDLDTLCNNCKYNMRIILKASTTEAAVFADRGGDNCYPNSTSG